MPRLIFKCNHLKGGSKNAAHLDNYVRYMATRQGVEKIDPGHMNWRATKKQQKLIEQLLHDFPLVRSSFEYEDYKEHPTRANATEFITRCIEDNLDQVAKRENYVGYIAKRPRAERMGQHGLFTSTENAIILSQVADEIAHHLGNVWLPIISLRREDAARLGFDNAQTWRDLLTELAPKMAAAMKIPWEEFRWYAAYHDEGHHPHIHMVCYSADGRSGFLTKDGIALIKHDLVKEIFAHEMTELYQRQTIRRDDLVAQTRDAMEKAIQEMKDGTMENQRIEDLTRYLAQQLLTVKGKKQYGYLKPSLKSVVDEIVDELEKDPRIANAYELWYQLREDVLSSYRDDLPERMRLSQQKEFKQIRNMVIQEALRLNQIEVMEPQAFDDPPLPDPLPPEDASDSDAVLPLGPNVSWSEEYKRARAYLYGSGGNPPDFEEAYTAFLNEAQRGNALAMCDLGRMYADGLGRDPDPDQAQQWYAKALAALLALEEVKPDRYTQYRIGKLYAGGLGSEQDYHAAANWFGMAAEKRHKYAQYSLAGLYLRGQGVAQDDEQAYRLYLASVEQGFPYAAFELGKLLRDGRGCEVDTSSADEWFMRAYQGFSSLEAQSHDDKLQYRLGWMLLHGVGVDKDEEDARTWFEKAARLDNANAQYQLAKLILSDPAADPRQIEQAVKWLTRSAEAGQDCAQYALGKLYRDGIGVEKDTLQAVMWFSKAVEQDNSYAAYALGKIYLAGNDVPKDVDKALRWLQHSADCGNEYAQYRLGILYLAGEGIPKNVSKAIEHLTVSAQKGNQYAQYQLGKLYLLGRDVERDEATAVRWFTQSASQGNEYARWFLDHINEFQGSTPLQCATRLLHHMGKIFQDQVPDMPMQVEIDRKLLQRIWEKKMAMGHKMVYH